MESAVLVDSSFFIPLMRERSRSGDRASAQCGIARSCNVRDGAVGSRARRDRAENAIRDRGFRGRDDERADGQQTVAGGDLTRVGTRSRRHHPAGDGHPHRGRGPANRRGRPVARQALRHDRGIDGLSQPGRTLLTLTAPSRTRHLRRRPVGEAARAVPPGGRSPLLRRRRCCVRFRLS